MTSKSLKEALDASIQSSTHKHNFAPEDSPWDDLANWYWNLWEEFEGGAVGYGNHTPDTMLNSADNLSFATSHQDNDKSEIMIQTPENSASTALENVTPDLPPRCFIDVLVPLYFKHVHPLCPIFNEVEFYAAYSNNWDRLLVSCVTLLEFRAILFAGSMHLNHDQICNTTYASTMDCHQALFEAARREYHKSDKRLPISLTRAAILLSLWSPFNNEKESNCYWVDQAFLNARTAISREDSSISPCFQRILWWSCQLRNSTLSFALRRVDCLQEVLTNAVICIDDFDDISGPCFSQPFTRTLIIDNFILRCRLSQIMNRIILFQTQQGYIKYYNGCQHVNFDEILEVVCFYNELAALREEFESLRYISEVGLIEHDVAFQLSSIIVDSVIASLYFPYTFLATETFNVPMNKFIENATHEVVEAASRIAINIGAFAIDLNSSGISMSLGAWLTFPIVLKLIILGNICSPHHAAKELQELRNLMKVLHVLRSRFNGGQFICDTLDTAMKRIRHNNIELNSHIPLSQLHTAAGHIQQYVDSGVVDTFPALINAVVPLS